MDVSINNTMLGNRRECSRNADVRILEGSTGIVEGIGSGCVRIAGIAAVLGSGACFLSRTSTLPALSAVCGQCAICKCTPILLLTPSMCRCASSCDPQHHR